MDLRISEYSTVFHTEGKVSPWRRSHWPEMFLQKQNVKGGPEDDDVNSNWVYKLKRVIVTPTIYLCLVEFLHFDIQSTG